MTMAENGDEIMDAMTAAMNPKTKDPENKLYLNRISAQMKTFLSCGLNWQKQ